ncbi:MAG: magnesium transporter [Puniceicoccales bacterium]|jgi:magnesium transporter|nr:magnesium transporter [Puniceicoccales bacterium]
MLDFIQNHPIAKQLDQYTLDELDKHLESPLKSLDLDKLARTSPYIVSNFLERLTVNERRNILKRLSNEHASHVLAEMDVEDSAEVLSAMREFRAARIIELMDADDAADLIGQLDEGNKIRLLAHIHPETAFALRKLLRYDPNTAGGVMNPAVATLRQSWTLNEALSDIRQHKEKVENLYDLYVLDDKNRLVGITSLKDLVFSQPTQRIGDIMRTNIRNACLPEVNKEIVANTMAAYNLFSIPVVDEKNRLLGIITHDDVLDIVQEAATADLQQLHGAGADESIHDTVWYSLKKRNPWLLINLLTACLSAFVISKFGYAIERMSWMAAFMTVIASIGGNTGAQTLAVAIRGLALDEFRKGDGLFICAKELLKGALNGLLVGFLGGLVAMQMSKNFLLGLTVFLSMALTMLLSGLVAAIIPLILRRLRFDPAQSSYIFLTAITDVAGLFIFLAIGTRLLLSK